MWSPGLCWPPRRQSSAQNAPSTTRRREKKPVAADIFRIRRRLISLKKQRQKSTKCPCQTCQVLRREHGPVLHWPQSPRLSLQRVERGDDREEEPGYHTLWKRYFNCFSQTPVEKLCFGMHIRDATAAATNMFKSEAGSPPPPAAYMHGNNKKKIVFRRQLQ